MPDHATILAWSLSFALGSVPFGLVVARVSRGGDLTSRGSGNIGATNVSRVLGFWPAGFATFALDALKGALPVLVMGLWARGSFSPLQAWAAVLCAVLGHCYSPWLGFRGGKGVATAFGGVLVLAPLAALAGLVGFAAGFGCSRIGSLSSLAGLLAASGAYLVAEPFGVFLWPAAGLVLVVLVRHERNLDALLESREKAFA